MTPFLAFTIFAAVLGMFQFGFNTGVMNAPQNVIEDFIGKVYRERYGKAIEATWLSTIFSMAVSAFLVGGIMGALSGGWLANSLGRKKALLYSQSMSILGAILSGCSKLIGSYEMIIIGRLLIGIACGLYTGLVPLFVSEILPVKLRGSIGIFNQLSITLGILFSMALGLNGVLGSINSWPILICFTILPSVLQSVLLYMVPESPRYLILEMKDESAGENALIQLRNTDNVTEELNAIKAESNSSDQSESLSVRQLLKLRFGQMKLALFVTICVHLSQQLSGMPAILYYSTKIFTISGLNCDESQYATLGLGVIMVMMNFVTILLMDKLGRRRLHLIGLTGMIVCLILMTVILNGVSLEYLDCDQAKSKPNTNGMAGIFAMITSMIFVGFFALGPGPVPWIVTGEFYTQPHRSAAVAIGTCANWGANLLVAIIFPQLQTRMANYSFLPFVIVLVLLFLTLFFYMPETHGVPVKEVESLFQIPNAWKRPIGYCSKWLLMENRFQGHNEMSRLLNSTNTR